jgi:integrase
MSSPPSSAGPAGVEVSHEQTPTAILDALGSVNPELTRVLGALASLVERPIPLTLWRDRIVAKYAAKAKTTRLKMAQALREALELAGPGANTTSLTTELVARFGAREGATSTTNGLLASLRRGCKLALKAHQVNPDRLEGATWRVREKTARRRKHHPRKDVLKVLKSLRAKSGSWDGGRLYALTAVYAYTGIRKMEALRLRVEDVDLVRGFIFIRASGVALKTDGSTAPVPCPAVLVAILRVWLGRCNSAWAFPTRNRRSPWTGGTNGRRPTDRLVAAGAAVGVAGFTPLSLRHSLATHMASHWGLTAKQIQMILRHSIELTQDHYVHPDLVNLEELVRGFDYGNTAPRSRSGPRRDRPHPLLTGRKRRRPAVARPIPAAKG